MKGIVFTEFLEMVEKKFGYATVDAIIEESNLPSEGSYTSVGTYDYGEMVLLISNLSDKMNLPIPELLRSFGGYIFDTFLKSYPSFFERSENSFEFLESIDNHVHIEVKKLYPDAELPRFETNRVSDDTLEMIYSSTRKMGEFAIGLIEKTMAHYGEPMVMNSQILESDGSKIKFTITKVS